MSGSGGIGGNLETSILMDVSGVRLASETAIDRLQELQGAVNRTSASFTASTALTAGYTDSIDRAAEMVELLALKMLTLQANYEKTGSAAKRAAADINAATSAVDDRSLTNVMMGGSLSASTNRAAEEEAKRVAELRRRRAEMQAQREFDDARRFAAGAQNAPDMRTAPNQINPRFFQMSRELRAWERARVAAQGMRDAIFQARVALDPMVGLEARLANEADEFADNMNRAVRQGHMTQAQADELLQTYQQLTAQQVLQARNQQQSFLGMRNFGFVAQQGAYAIEDFAQVFGTMGVAGGIRAAGNNLTAMAATMGPMVGVFASLAAAAVMIGLHLWETADATKEAEEAEERRLKLMEDIADAYEKQIRSERTLAELRTGSLSDFAGAISRLQEETDERMVSSRAEMIAQADERVQELKSLLSNVHGQSTNLIRGVGAAGPGAAPHPDMLREMERLRELELKQQQLNQAQKERLTAELEKQQALLESMQSGQYFLLEREKQRAAILQRTNELLAEQPPLVENMLDLQLQYAVVMQQRFEAEEAENERVRIAVDLAERMLRLREEGERAAESVRDTIMGRAEGLNEELRFEQEILETRKKIQEQIDKAALAGTVTGLQATQARMEMERILRLEQERFDAQQKIQELQEKENELRKQVTRPAGLTGAITQGSEEAIRIFEEERLAKLSRNENQPVVDQLRQIAAEIRLQRAALEAIGDAQVNVAQLQGF